MKNKDKAVLAAVLILFAAPVAAILLIDFPEAGFDHYMTDVGIEVRGDGSLAVTEAYSFRWSGVDSGEMYITFSGEKRAALVESSVECMIDGTPAELVSYSAGSNASHAGFGGAMYARGPNPVSGDWEANAFYKRASSGEHTVSFSYVLEGAFAAYADCVDIYYKVFTTFQHDLADLTVTVSMPAGSLQGSTRIFGHGDPNGYCEFVGGSADAVFKSPMLPAYTMFEIRVVSQQTDLYPAAPAGAGKTFASIMEEERKFLEDTERDVLLAKIQILLIVAMVASTLLALLAMSRLLPRNKPGFDQPYTREIPPVKPNVAARLARYRGLNMQSGMGDKITAAVLDLALRGSIAIEKGAGGEITFVSLDQPVQLTRFERGV
ncbi:MAG: DUF2207 domain-containing protein, partial [Methanomassiliicoccaceae archaeon]|nr:DUF2207 domain-containing protein [Methanomassiliicoccaceae archaeon]